MFNFPAGPIVGQKYPTAPTGSTPQYMWDGEKWVGMSTGGGTGGGASVSTQDTPPLSPADGDLWWESDTGTLYVAYADVTSTQWVSTATPATGWFVSKVGDTMTGALTIAPSAGAALNLNKALATNANSLNGQMGGVQRWALQLGQGGGEGGSNAGSDFALYNYSDAGAVLGSPALLISRANGYAYFNAPGASQTPVSSNAGGHTALIMNKAAGATANNFQGMRNSLNRWIMVLGDTTPESGGNAGSNFSIFRYDDSGGNGSAAFSIDRKSSYATFGTIVQCQPGAQAASAVNLIDNAGTFKGSINFNHSSGVMTVQNQGSVFSFLSDGSVSFPGTAVTNGYIGRKGLGGVTGQANNFYWNNTAMEVWVGTVNVGTITGTSDYRVKKDVTPLDSMWAKLKALKPIRFSFKDYTPPEAVPDQGEVEPRPLIVGNDVEQWGFLAHELQETLTPSAAFGTKDEVGALQSPNPWTIIAALTKTVQEMQARIETLEAKVA